MNSQKKIKIRNKKTGEIIEVAPEQFVDESSSQGWSGVTQDLKKSAANFLPATGEMLAALPEQITEAGKNIVKHPIKSPMQVLAGVGEGGIGLLNAYGKGADYLADKGIVSKEAAGKALHIPDLGVEKFLGLDNPDKGDQFLKVLGNILAPGKLASLAGEGRAVKSVANAGAFGAQAVGQGQDPVQAAIMSVLVPHLAKKGFDIVKKVPGAVNRAAGVPPDMPPPGGGAPPANPNMMTGGATPIAPTTQSVAPTAPAPGIAWNAKLPESVSWMQNIPQAALNVGGGMKDAAQNAISNIPEAAGSAAGSVLEKAADFAPKFAQGVAQPTLGALASYLKHISVSPEELAKRKVLGDIKPAHVSMIEQRTQAAERLNLPYLSPAEAMLSTFEAEKQGGIGRTSTGSQELYSKGAERTASEVDASRKFLDTIYNDEQLAPEKKAAYEETMTGRVPHEFIVEKQKLPVVQEAMKKLQSDSAYRQIIERELGVPLDTVNPKTFRYWDVIKRVLYDMEDSKKSKHGKSTTRSNEVGNTRRQMVRQMDEIKPEYQDARALSERQQVRGELEHHFDKKPMTLNNWNKYLSSSSKYENLVHKLRDNPDAQQMLHDIHLLGGNIIPNEMDIRTAAKLKRTGMSEPRNKLDALKRDLDERFGQAHDVAAVKLMTSKDWPKVLAAELAKKRK